MKCPNCGHRLDVRVSGNLRFYSCLNASCNSIWSEVYTSSIHHRLPVDVEEVRNVLVNECIEAKKAEDIIGEGKTVYEKYSNDRKIIIAEINVRLKEPQTFRTYDAVYYGQVLGVVANHEGNVLTLVLDASKKIPRD